MPPPIEKRTNFGGGAGFFGGCTPGFVVTGFGGTGGFAWAYATLGSAARITAASPRSKTRDPSTEVTEVTEVSEEFGGNLSVRKVEFAGILPVRRLFPENPPPPP
jgi:hypothetical protein